MKNIIKSIFLKLLRIKLNIEEYKEFLVWQNHYHFEEPFPHFVKKKVFQKFNSNNTIWVETGTFYGVTAKYLSQISKFVYTIEPSTKYFELAKDKLFNQSNYKIYNGTSEDYLEIILSEIPEGSTVSFWLDGHWSGGDTYKGNIDTPIEFELEIISKFLTKFHKTTVLVDDVRLFSNSFKKKEVYPDKSILINWATKNNLNWKISRDIFIAFVETDK
tara:strand:- start:678 stop:1328 length:651 start_codon:yes stop_codon:yes gene_type:complete